MIKILLSLLLLLLFVGCSSKRPEALPATHAHNLPWGAIDLDINSTKQLTMLSSLGSAITQKAVRYEDSNSSVPFNILALSGGGSRGAFGTGLLMGWKNRGDIPNFDVVTGVSTGAVMAPFIFVGGKELQSVIHFYTKMYTEEIFTSSWLSILGDGYIMHAEPLKKLFKENFDKEFLNKVAAEHKKGRRFYVGTTNMDTGQMIVWDMGAIASSDKEDKYERFCDIIYASTALPVYLPPQYMKVNIDSKDYYQMHVDGGVYSQVFMIGLLVNWRKVLKFPKHANKNFDTTLYTVSNRKYRQRDIYKPVKQSALGITEAYLLTEMDLLYDNTLYRMYRSCKKKDIKFRLISIPEKMPVIVDEPTNFEPKKMIKLYNVGYNIGNKPIKWKKTISIDEYDIKK